MWLQNSPVTGQVYLRGIEEVSLRRQRSVNDVAQGMTRFYEIKGVTMRRAGRWRGRWRGRFRPGIHPRHAPKQVMAIECVF
jgi:hypothetical protein